MAFLEQIDSLLNGVISTPDLSGEMVEIPSGLVAGPPPMSNDFFFSELM